MKRRKNGLVPNEIRVLICALQLMPSSPSFHGYALRTLWDETEDSPRSMSYATLYRCLDRLEERGLLDSHIDDDPDRPSRPRRMFTLTGEGVHVAVRLTQEQDDVGGATSTSPAIT